MPTTQYKGLSVQTLGSNSGTWGVGAPTALNEGVISPVDSMLGGILVKSLASTSIVLTATESQSALLVLTGTLLAPVNITTLCQGFFFCENKTTGNYSASIVNGYGGTTCVVPQYSVRQIFSDLTYGVRAIGLPPPGTMVSLAVPTAALHPSLSTEYILPYGQAVSRTAYAALFALFGVTYGSGDGATTFNMPDLRGRTVFGMDNMGGSPANRITVAGSGIDGTVFGNTGGSQSTTLTSAGQLPAHNHTASAVVTDPGHTHGLDLINNLSGSSGGSATEFQNNGGVSTRSATTGITVAVTVNNTGSGTAFGTMNPAFLCNWMLKT